MTIPETAEITGLQIVQAAIVAAGLGEPGETLFMGREPDSVEQPADLSILVTEQDGDPHFTMGTAVAMEHQNVQVKVRGLVDEYHPAKARAIRIRYTIAALKEHVVHGVRVTDTSPVGNVLHLGPDERGREEFTVNFNIQWEPPYVY
ncbi:hypothetical protein SEA_WHEELBITE_33 [Arthrobacter phage Wheelbite]|uniref:Tail terminator n=1 Tax=Arthrobacter phage Wheelbite TaxID=2015873 RepID=A0A222ZHD2_9CAUD|nr:head-tail connector protein [Arthrobacter phage Wheelbite]ASR84126.1 hypothetical protein SEA_WHEELBITE_33 [Arthrobacter phage Wheelbite]